MREGTSHLVLMSVGSHPGLRSCITAGCPVLLRGSKNHLENFPWATHGHMLPSSSRLRTPASHAGNAGFKSPRECH